jgi:hypothetical protein
MCVKNQIKLFKIITYDNLIVVGKEVKVNLILLLSNLET